jgi:hypothetical protein
MRKAILWMTAAPILLCALWALLWLRQWEFRRHVAELLTDVNALQVNQTKQAGAQALMRRWRGWASLNTYCNRTSRCEYSIQLDLWMPDRPDFVYQEGRHWMARIFDHLGLRSAHGLARLHLENDTVTEKYFDLDIALPEHLWWTTRPSLEAAFEEHTEPWLRSAETARNHHHIHYRRIRLEAEFDPQETQTVQQAFTDFRLQCLTRWNPCMEESDLVPGIWNQLQTDSQQNSK